eukprot:m.1298663 g.1298663  ORF g.1298663 m.1298663 type:complete len:85 (-) comp24798_c1_seq90:4408-4662(-)
MLPCRVPLCDLQMCMDEVVHACAVASLDFKKRLATMPCLLPKGERRCTICHEDEFEAGDDESEHLVGGRGAAIKSAIVLLVVAA